ncbi:MAG: calcium/sodium antiporter [Desulfobacterales bacterium]|jgi:cation:H+ antiporter|nr:calcium/sodium antiporter [Desulfobacterales bacterium]
MGIANLGLIFAGLVFLLAGAEMLVRGASRLAALAGISPLVIGLTVVAYGTGAPELAVSLRAGLYGNSDIAVSNVVGSNIFNVLFVLGACAAVTPLRVRRQLVRLDVPIMIAVSILLLAIASDGRLGRGIGGVLLAGLAAYTVWSIRQDRRSGSDPGHVGSTQPSMPGTQAGKPGGMTRQVLMTGVGLALLILGSGWLVDGMVALARFMGVSDIVIGLTLIAAGTSLPEAATSVVAAYRGECDLAIGNAVGSNIFNILGIIGLSALVSPGGLNVAPSLLNFDMVVMVAVAVACLPVFFTGYSIGRWEGWLFIGAYAAYTTYLLLRATEHDALPVFSTTMVYFVMPLLALTALALGAQKRRKPQTGSGND